MRSEHRRKRNKSRFLIKEIPYQETDFAGPWPYLIGQDIQKGYLRITFLSLFSWGMVLHKNEINHSIH